MVVNFFKNLREAEMFEVKKYRRLLEYNLSFLLVGLITIKKRTLP